MISMLTQQLKDAAEPDKLLLLNKLSSLYLQNKTDISSSLKKSIEISTQALEIARKLSLLRQEAIALTHLGYAYRKQGNYPKALQVAMETLGCLEKTGDKKEIAKCNFEIGQFHKNSGKPATALKFFLKSLNIREEIGSDTRGTIYVLTAIGDVYKQTKDYKQALDYYRKALNKYTIIGDKRDISAVYKRIGDIYYFQNDRDQALENYLRAASLAKKHNNIKMYHHHLGTIAQLYEIMKQTDKAIEYFTKSKEIEKDIGNIYLSLRTLTHTSRLYIQLEQYEKALMENLAALELTQKLNRKSSLSWAFYEIGENFKRLKKYDRAIKTITHSLIIAQEINNKGRIKKCYQSLSDIYENKREFRKALEHYKKFFYTNEILSKEASNKAMVEIQNRHDLENQQKQIEILKQKNTIQILQLSKEKLRRQALLIGLILVFAIAVLLFKRYLYLFSFWKKQKYISQYRLMQEVGAGGMGNIFKAQNIRDKTETVAVKILKPEHFQDEKSRRRFKNEGTLIDRLNHPHIVKIYERGEYKQKLFIAMEYLNGINLADKLVKQGKFGFRTALHIMVQIAECIDFIHSKNVMHRDLKPQNIMIIQKGDDLNYVKLLDFGLAKSKFQTKITRTGILIGTISYMAPEQITSTDSSFPSDIFSLGIIFYQMITGKLPFEGDTPTDVMRKIMGEDPVEPIKMTGNLPEKCNQLILNMLDKDPKKRPTATVLLESLQALSEKTKGPT